MSQQELSYEDVLKLLENLHHPDEAEKYSARLPCLVERYAAYSQTDYLALCRVIDDAIEILRQENEAWARIVRLRFVEGQKIAQIAYKDGISERQVQNLQQAAVSRLAKDLNAQEARCQQGSAPACGDRGIDLAYRLPLISSAFGRYFAGLLEESNNYCYLSEQIECATTVETRGLPPLSRIQYLLRKPKGPRLMIVTGASGVGKTTFATKLLKCLYEENDADRILGGSAKTEYVDVITQEARAVEADFRDADSFYRRLYTQLGLPPVIEGAKPGQLVRRIQGWLRDHHLRAVIVLDNLENLDGGEAQRLVELLQPLLGRECRAVITTRYLNSAPQDAFLVTLRPLSETVQARRFLEWHIRYYAAQQTGLNTLTIDDKKAELLVRKSGGLPLLMQLLLSSVVLFGWPYLDRDMPYGEALYNFLYRQHWDALTERGPVGKTAQNLARFIIDRQRRGTQTRWQDIDQWRETDGVSDPSEAMRLLSDRFLVINRNSGQGDFVTFPSFTDFVRMQPLS